MNTLGSAVPIHIHVDVQLTVTAGVLYRLVGTVKGKGSEKAESRTIYRNLVRYSDRMTVADDEFLVRPRSPSKVHYLVSAAIPTLHKGHP